MSCTWLITGGAGFIGSHLVEAVLGRGDAAVVLDDCSTGSLANLAAVAGHPRLTVMHGSVCDDLRVDEAMARADRVVHLAAAVGVMRILERRVGSITVNLRGTETVLRAASAHGGRPVFLASSSEVYGKSAAVPFREDGDCVLGPPSLHRWSYAGSKLMDEFLALAWNAERKLPVVVGRFFNVTGPRQTGAYGMVLPRLCRAALAGRPLEVYGDGLQSRCFLHVADAVAAVLALMDCPAAVGQTVNIGASEEISIRDLAGRVLARCGKEGAIRHVPYATAYPGGGFEDLRRRVPDTTRLRHLTGWTQRHGLDRIIADTIDHCRRHEDCPESA